MGIFRFLLAISVVFAHCGSIYKIELVGGKLAVQAFYIISGFYMTMILNEKYIGLNNSYKLFISNRLLRLFPIYWAVLLGTLVTCYWIGIKSEGHTYLTFDSYKKVEFNYLTFGYLLFTNLFILGQDLLLFMGINAETGTLFFSKNYAATSPALHTFVFISPAWTLGLEILFYMIAPFIVKKRLKIIIITILSSLLLRFFIYHYLGFKNDPWTNRFFPTELIFFLFGYLSYKLYLKMKELTISKSKILFIFSILIIFTFSYQYLSLYKPFFSPFLFKELIYFLTVIVSIPFLFIFFKGNNLDNKIGELSYPIYISHILVATICGVLPFTFLKNPMGIVLSTIFISFLLNKLISDPIDRYRQSRLI